MLAQTSILLAQFQAVINEIGFSEGAEVHIKFISYATEEWDASPSSHSWHWQQRSQKKTSKPLTQLIH